MIFQKSTKYCTLIRGSRYDAALNQTDFESAVLRDQCTGRCLGSWWRSLSITFNLKDLTKIDICPAYMISYVQTVFTKYDDLLIMVITYFLPRSLDGTKGAEP